MRKLALLAAAVLLMQDDGARLPPEVFSPRVLQGHGTGSAAAQLAALVPSSGTLAQRLEVIEAMLLRETLLRQRWNKTRAAQELGLSRVGLRSKIQRFGLEPGRGASGGPLHVLDRVHGLGDGGHHGCSRSGWCGCRPLMPRRAD